MIVTEIDIKDIEVDDEFNCRNEAIVPSDVQDLMMDIKNNGLLSPVLVRPSRNKGKYKYFLFAGFRRYASFKFLKKEKIPAIIHEDVSDEYCEEVNMKENMFRQNLNILQEAHGLNKFYLRGRDIKYISEVFDKGRDWVQVRIDLLKLPKNIQLEAASGVLHARNIKDIYQIYKTKGESKAFEMVADIKDRKIRNERRNILNSKKVENTVTQRKMRGFSEIFDIQGVTIDALGTNLAARALAWAMHEISTYELLQDVKAEMKLMGDDWVIPIVYEEPKYKEDKIQHDSNKG